MLALALYPLAFYLFFLVVLNGRNRPTVLNGSLDFLLLCCGLSGLALFGPGRLLVPLAVMKFWGIVTWFFWIAFYFVMVYVASLALRQRIVIYHCRPSEFLPRLTEWGRQWDPRFRLDGNVLFLPGFGIQATVTSDAIGGHILLQATKANQNPANWQKFERLLSEQCRQVPSRNRVASIVWGVLSLGTLIFSTVILVREGSRLYDTFIDLWF